MDDGNLTPYHGQYEGHSKLFLGTTLCFSTMAILFLAFSFLLGVQAHSPLNVLNLVCVSVVILCGAVTFVTIFRRLSAQIAKGNEGADFLDWARLNLSAMAQIFSIAVMILAGQLMRR